MSVSKIIGWVLTGLLVLLYVSSGVAKFVMTEAMAKEMKVVKETIWTIGAVEIAIAILFAIPRTAFLGAILLTGYMGGAIMVHVGKGELPIAQAIIAVVVWVALGLRQPEIFQLAIGNSPCPTPADSPAQPPQ